MGPWEDLHQSVESLGCFQDLVDFVLNKLCHGNWVPAPLSHNLTRDASTRVAALSHLNKSVVSSISEGSATVDQQAISRLYLFAKAIEKAMMRVQFAFILFFDSIN